MSGDHGQDVSVGMGYTLLFEGDVSSTYERSAIKEKIIKK